MAARYGGLFGTVSHEAATGADAIFLNVEYSLSANWVPYVAAHEYFHIVQGHVAGTQGGQQSAFPTWFLEGVADWEAVKLEGAPFPNWLDLVRVDEQSGRGLPLSRLVSWDQWESAGDSPLSRIAKVNKARVAAMFLEEVAGPTAAATILEMNANGGLAGFETALKEVSGFTMHDFERALAAFVQTGSGETTD